MKISRAEVLMCHQFHGSKFNHNCIESAPKFRIIAIIFALSIWNITTSILFPHFPFEHLNLISSDISSPVRIACSRTTVIYCLWIWNKIDFFSCTSLSRLRGKKTIFFRQKCKQCRNKNHFSVQILNWNIFVWWALNSAARCSKSSGDKICTMFFVVFKWHVQSFAQPKTVSTR